MRNRRHPHITRRHIRKGTAKCAYCAEAATTLDHVIPKSKPVDESPFTEAATISDKQRPKVPACQRCNGTLGNREFVTFEERKAWVLHKVAEAAEKQERRPAIQANGPTKKQRRQARKLQVAPIVTVRAGVVRAGFVVEVEG